MYWLMDYNDHESIDICLLYYERLLRFNIEKLDQEIMFNNVSRRKYWKLLIILK